MPWSLLLQKTIYVLNPWKKRRSSPWHPEFAALGCPVADTKVGIVPKLLANIFPLSRKQYASQKKEATGLGQTYAQDMERYMEVNSELEVTAPLR